MVEKRLLGGGTPPVQLALLLQLSVPLVVAFQTVVLAGAPSTITVKLVLPVSEPSLAVSVMTLLPDWPAAGVSETVR